MSNTRRDEREIAELASNVLDAVRGMTPWTLPQAVLGRLRVGLPTRRSEYTMFASREIRRTARYLVDVTVPSLHRPSPRWVPEVLRSVFFHETTIHRRPDHLGSYDSRPDEAWFFINGILTDLGMATWNADYLAVLFQRPFTIIQNATDGPISDLLECADEKAFGMNGEPLNVGFPAIHAALKDPTKERVVVIAHSQGTLISAVLVKLLRLVYERRGELISGDQQADELAGLRRRGVTLDLDKLEDVSADELARLEIYCFANCASEMRYVDPDRSLPWIESFGNEHDLVARLGMLAPNLAREDIAIDGPMWVHRGAWGHLLNAHYLDAIADAQGIGPTADRTAPTAAPYEHCGGREADHPRLYDYLGGGQPL